MNILVSGGTGAFSQAFIEKLLRDNTYQRICVFSRDEAKQAYMRLKFNNDSRLRFFIGDVRDVDRLKRAMNRVDVVVHAAALKRIEVGHYNPEEMIKTNVLGAMNIIDAAVYCKVKKVIGLSTDKAFQPVSPYGHSKALAEQLLLSSNDTHGPDGPKFSVTRYGNVSGSTGSVIPIWREILKTSDTVPVTDPECTRFWMYMDEAVNLVLETIKHMPSFPVIPKLPAYRLGDLAMAMGAKMNITGLNDFEKRHESMSEYQCSADARRMDVEELREALKNV